MVDISKKPIAPLEMGYSGQNTLNADTLYC